MVILELAADDDLMRFMGKTARHIAETQFDQPRESPAVVEVRMGEKHRVNLVGTDGEALPVSRLEVVLLIESAVHQDILAVGLKQVAGTGHVAGCTMETESDVQFAFSSAGNGKEF